MMHYLEVIENPEWWAASQHLGWLFRGEADHVTRNMILAETRTRILALCSTNTSLATREDGTRDVDLQLEAKLPPGLLGPSAADGSLGRKHL